jgi:hypothetical protein
MAMESIHGLMEGFTRVSTKMTRRMAMESFNMLMEVFTRASSKMAR